MLYLLLGLEGKEAKSVAFTIDELEVALMVDGSRGVNLNITCFIIDSEVEESL